MSLLMDALKRAESSKQQALRTPGGRTVVQPNETLSLEPLATDGNAPSNPLPDLANHIDAVDIELASSAAQPTTPSQAIKSGTSPSQGQQDRQAARNAFAAKQTNATPSRLPLWLTLGTLATAAIGIGGYVWYQLNAMNKGSLAAPPVAVAPSATRTLADQAAPAATAPAPNSIFSPFSGSTVGAGEKVPETRLFTPRRESSPPQAPIERDRPTQTAPIRLTRTTPVADPLLMQGHTDLQRGDLDRARVEYEQALQRDPNNTDALLALAAIAQRQNRPSDAENFRQRAWIANPSDPATQSAMLSGNPAKTDPQATESRLKTLLAEQPESAPLNFALGNLFARQNRWSEAQAAYFNAAASDGDNPDYLFNLAVSLDHLRQPRLAAQHYRLALESAARRPAGFDRDGVARRLDELQQSSVR